MTITVVFGIEDAITADIVASEAVDGCDIEGDKGSIATIDPTEFADFTTFTVDVLRVAQIAAQDAADICAIYATSNGAVDIATAESGDVCAIIGTTIAVTPVINRFLVKVRDDQFLVVVAGQLEESEA